MFMNNEEDIKRNLKAKIDFFVHDILSINNIIENNKNIIEQAKKSKFQITKECTIFRSKLWVIHLELIRDRIKEEVEKLQKELLEEELEED